MPTGGTSSNRSSRVALSPPGGQGCCWGHVGGCGVDVARESAPCSAEAGEKGQDQCGGMHMGCPQQLPRPTAPKAAHFAPQAATCPGLGAPSSLQHPPCCSQGRGKGPKPPAARGLSSRRRHTAGPPARRCSSTFLGCTAGAGRGRVERRLLAAVRALPWTGADLLLQNINKRLQEREGNLARNFCRSWLVIEE